MELYEKLKNLRKERGLTQSDLGGLIGQERSTIACYETNKRTPDVATLEKLAAVFGVTLDYFSNKSASDTMIDLMARTSEFFSSQNVSEVDRDQAFQDIMRLYLKGKEQHREEKNKTNERKNNKTNTDGRNFTTY